MLFSEWKKKKQEQNQTTTITPTTPEKAETSQYKSPASFSEWKQKKDEYKATPEGWYDDSRQLLNDVQDYYLQYRTEDDYYKGFQDRTSKLLSTANNLRSQYQGNTEAISYIDSVASALSGITDFAKKKVDYYSQWESEDAYKSDVQINKWLNRYKGKSYTDLKDALANMDQESDEYNWLTQYAPTTMKAQDYDNELSSVGGELEKLQADYDEYKKVQRLQRIDNDAKQRFNELLNQYGSEANLKGRIEELKSQKWSLENNKKYNLISKNKDFETVSKDIPEEATTVFGVQFGDNFFGWGDPIYNYINDLEGARKKAVTMSENRGAPYQKYDFMNDNEIATYNYLYNTEGKDAAKDYLEYIEYDLNERITQNKAQQSAKFATENPVYASIMSVPTNLLGGLGALDVAWQNIEKNVSEAITGNYSGPIDYNTPSMGISVQSSTIRGTVSQNLADQYGTINLNEDEHPLLSKVFNGKSFGDVYQLGMSMADSATIAALSPILGTAGTVLLGGSAASQGILDAVSAGASDEQALMMGVINGAFEMLFEKYELENLLGNASDGVLKAVLKQALSEGVGEGATTIANTIGDIAIMAEKSDFRSKIADYVAQGLSEEEATKQAFLDAAVQIGWDFVGGMASGGIMGGGASVIEGVINTHNQNVATKDEYDSFLSDLLNESLEINPDNELAKKLQTKLDKGKNISGSQIRNLVELNELTVRGQDTDLIQKAAISRLTELGESSDVEALGKALTKQATGEKLSKAEQQIISNSRYGQRVANELNVDNIRSGEYSSAWAEKIGTNKLNAEEYGRLLEEAQATEESTVNVADNSQGVQLKDLRKDASVSSPKSETPKTSVTESDKITIERDGEEVEVKVSEIASIEDGDVMLKLEDGEVVSAHSVNFGTTGRSLVFEAASDMASRVGGFNTDTANLFVKGFDPEGDLSIARYVAGWSAAYKLGTKNSPPSALESNMTTSMLSKSQREMAYNLGKAFGNDEVALKQEKITSTDTIKANKDSQNGPKKKKGKVHFDGARYGKNLTERQRASLKGLRVIAEALGIDIYVVESKQVNGKRVGENGKYNPQDHSIEIDLFAGAEAEALMLFTAAHELTHHIREVLPDKFNVLADTIFEEYTKRFGESTMASLIAEKTKTLKENGRITDDMTDEDAYDLAYEEVIADCCETMLTDSNAIEALSKSIYAKDKGLWEAIKKFIVDLMARITKAYETVIPDSEEGQRFRDLGSAAERIKNIWVEAIIEASEVEDSGEIVEIDTSTETVAPMFSERTWKKSDYVTHRDQMAKKIANALGVSLQKAKTYIDDINSIAKMIADDRTRLDYEASSFGSAFVSNVEYGGSFDYTTLCKKRRIYTGTFTEIQKRLKDVALSPDDILKIRNLLIEEGVEATCGLCYVEGSRANMGKFAKEFIRLYKRDNPLAWIPNMADVNTPDGVEQMRISHPEVYDQYVYFWNHYGKLKDSDPALFASQQKPKLYEARKEYKGEILEHFKGDSSVAKKNLNGGIRMQSFSDFEIVHLIDTMQVIMDMSTVGLAGQAYTKVPEFAKAFGNTGLKINLSLIAKGVDGNGNLIFDDREGMPHETAFELRDRYSKNVGTIIVTFTDEQLLAAMADPRIDFIIPFHRSQWKKGQYGAMGLPKGTKDYTFMQNEKLIKQTYHEYKGRMVKDKTSNYMPNEYWDFSKSGKENAEVYLKMCAENNKRPKFYKLLDYDGKGTYSLKADGSTDGYWKLLIDFKMYDNGGVGSPQQAVTPTFNMDEAKTMLDEYQGGHSKYPSASSVVDTFVKEYNEEHRTKYADRASAKSGYTAIREALAKNGLDELSEKLGNYFPISASFDATMKADNNPLTMTTVKKGNVEWKKGESAFTVGKKAFRNVYGTKTEVHIEQMGIDAVLYTDVANESISKVVNKKDKTSEQAILDVIPHLKEILGNSILASVERIKHTDNKNTALYGYRLYNLYWLEENNKKTPHCLVCTVVQNTEQAEGYVFRDIENVTIDHGLPGKKTDMPTSVNDDVYTISQLYRFVKGLKRENGGIKYSADEKSEYLFPYTKRKDGTLYSDRPSQKASYAPTFYSYMGKVVDEIKLEKMSTGGVVPYLKGKGVKAEEIKWSGIEAFLEGKKSVAKAELQEFVAGSQLQIVEQMSGEDIDLRYDGSKRAYNLYDSNGEVVDTFTYNSFLDGYVAESDEEIYSNEIELREALREDYGKESAPKWADYRIDGGTNYRELVFQLPNSTYSNRAMRAHWGQDAEGVLAHVRVQDMTTKDGKRMLFVEELQSDWHNEGHQKGYTTMEYEDAVAVYDKLAEDYANKRTAFNRYVRSGEFRSDPDEVSKKKFDWLRRKMDEAEKRMQDAERDINALKEKGMGDVPDAPFHNNYHEYVLKRLLRMAAEEDYDSIGWTTADIQSDRWSDEFAEGYRIEYDQDIPKFLRKYGKKWGATVGRTTLEGNGKVTYKSDDGEAYDSIREWFDDMEDAVALVHGDQIKGNLTVVEKGNILILQNKTTGDVYSKLQVNEGGVDIWSMDITDSMKNSVLYEGQVMYQERPDVGMSNRSLLANALESVAQNDIERNELKKYKNKIDLMEAEQTKLSELRGKIKELSFAKGPRDTEAIRSLQFEANQTANRINTYDRQLLNLESTKALKGVLEREKQMAYKRAEQKGKEALARYKEKAAETEKVLMNRYQESRKRGIEGRHKTEMRHKIKGVVNELNQYLLKGTKEKHVPIGLQKAVAEALEAVNMDTVGAKERIAKLEQELMKAKSPEMIQEISKRIDHVKEMGDRMDNKLQSLKASYDDFVNSDDPLIANSHDEVISNSISKVIKEVGSTPLHDMSLNQLESVYDLYKMVLTSVRNANKSFKAAKKEEISVIANRVMEEIDKVGKKKTYQTKAGQLASKFDWNNLKPVYAFERIGSDTFSEVFKSVRAGEDTWAEDITEAKEFSTKQREKFNYKSWDFKKRHEFTSTSGMKFELSLDQVMSLYAYSKRDQARDHLRKGGIVFDETTEVTIKTKLRIPVTCNPTQATAYNISDETLAAIIDTLTPDQKGFVDIMQDYLSTVMGAKGNEVSLELYGVKLYKEKNYFPLKSATQFMAKAKEQQKGEVKVKNSGFSKETVAKANNPIVLTPFMDVWADHVNDMSMYHAFVLPLEDFYRVYNYKTPTSDTMATESVEMYLQNAYGKAAPQYIDQLLKDLNGGARSDPTTGVINKLTGLFKKSAVFASLSVVIQQPSAIARATALVDSKHFVGLPSGKHSETWAEVKKYAPIAIIKEMGYFDVGMGQSTVEWIKDEKTWKDKVDDVASKAPALADELAWCSIWKAVKRETAVKNPGLKTNSEEFLKLAGERFTEVITKTQVYDSVLSRSANMRSKDTGMKMATAFMGEPTTSLNMLENALTQAKRGDKKKAAKAIGGVISSMVLNSILVSFVYAGRDDDEDKTYLEKYLSTLTEEAIDSINPLTLIPFVKDVVSIMQGYDVERSDMAIITDLIDAWNNLEQENRSAYRKVEDFAGAIASIFGLPVKNVMRDVRGIYNTINSFINGEDTTGAGVKVSLKEALTGDDITDGQQLYEAILNEDTTQIERVKERFKDQKAIDSAINKALRENDPRIKEAAEAKYNGDIAEYMRVAKEIIAEGYFKQDNIVSAINSEINALEKEDGATTSSGSSKFKSLYEMSDYYTTIRKNDTLTASSIKADIINTDIKNGKTKEEAEKSFKTKLTSEIKDKHSESKLTDVEAKNLLVKYNGMSQKDAVAKVQYWSFQKNYPDYELSESAVGKYYEYVKPSGIGAKMYYDYYKEKSKCIGIDSNGDGRADAGTVKAEILALIDSLPLTTAQKDALYFAEGSWKEELVNEAPWH